jgi:hypothetical protein
MSMSDLILVNILILKNIVMLMDRKKKGGSYKMEVIITMGEI